MPEQLAKAAAERWDQIQTALIFFAVGAIIGVGQVLSPDRQPPARLIIGRALSVGGLAVGAGAVVVWYPGLPLVGYIGISALLASFGVSGLERVFYNLLQRKDK